MEIVQFFSLQEEPVRTNMHYSIHNDSVHKVHGKDHYNIPVIFNECGMKPKVEMTLITVSGNGTLYGET